MRTQIAEQEAAEEEALLEFKRARNRGETSVEETITALIITMLIIFGLLHYMDQSKIVREFFYTILFFIGFPTFVFIVVYWLSNHLESQALKERQAKATRKVS
jgi:hypothetical protein